MPVPDLESFKVAAAELSSSTKFNNLVQAIEDEFGDIDTDQVTSLEVAKLVVGSAGQLLQTSGGVATWKGVSGVRANRTATQSIATATDTPIQFDAADSFDSDAYHDLVTNNTRLTIPAALGGIYVVAGGARFADNGTGLRALVIRKGGTTKLSEIALAPASSVGSLMVVTVESLAAADYVELVCHQTSGGALDIAPTLAPCWFAAVRLGV